jgi:hypothetical protein
MTTEPAHKDDDNLEKISPMLPFTTLNELPGKTSDEVISNFEEENCTR